MEYQVLEPRKPEHIALSFSGGGYRAASYSLGCLSYFESVYLGDKPFMSQVSFTSSASGGSITNLTYTLSQRKNQSFSDYYAYINEEVLYGTRILDEAIAIMNDKKRWAERPDKSRNLINAFSIAYDELIFKKEVFGIYFEESDGVREVCINTTDFNNGMLFRFQNTPVYGNYFLHFKKTSEHILKRTRLSDILAASSCFPVGFEPFMFPEDFTYSDLSKRDLESAIWSSKVYQPLTRKANNQVGFMDGGIDDNQGITSFMLAEGRLRSENKFGYDLYISCDVSSNYTPGFDFPVESRKAWLLKISVWQYVFVLMLLFSVSITGIYTHKFIALSYTILGALLLVTFIVGLIVIAGMAAYKKAHKKESTYVVTILSRIGLFLRMRLSTLLLLTISRLKSAGYLAAVVFLKKIRRSSYDRLFEMITEYKYDDNEKLLDDSDEEHVDKTVLKHWGKFSLQNAVYLLTEKNDMQRESTLKRERWYKKNLTVQLEEGAKSIIDVMKPTFNIQKVAQLATEMDTTLWYDEYHMRDNRNAALIATGQFTTCYNLLRYALRFDQNDLYWGALQTQLMRDWVCFMEDPYWMYNRYGKNQLGFQAVKA